MGTFVSIKYFLSVHGCTFTAGSSSHLHAKWGCTFLKRPCLLLLKDCNLLGCSPPNIKIITRRFMIHLEENSQDLTISVHQHNDTRNWMGGTFEPNAYLPFDLLLHHVINLSQSDALPNDGPLSHRLIV